MMLKHFMFALIFFISFFLHRNVFWIKGFDSKSSVLAEAKDKISCYKGIDNALINMTKACDYCTYREVQKSFNVTIFPNVIERDCFVGANPYLHYFNSNSTFNDINECIGLKDNEGKYKMLICDQDFCNEKCENSVIPSVNSSKISCFVDSNGALINETKSCEYCTYIEVQNSSNTALSPNGIQRKCGVGSNPHLNYFSGNKTKTFSEINDCVKTNNKDGTYKMLICVKDFCNEKCENGQVNGNSNGAFSALNFFSIFGIILSIFISF